ncbi:MAG: phosphotransferase family protein [Hyphomicrobiales bacterium]|nr:MAG: phosphotransferase family protein [Hyphomicrobiales bacterium]
MTTASAAATPIPPDVLDEWLWDKGIGRLQSALAPLAGGTQNRMYTFVAGGRELVLRCGPEHPRPSSNEALTREMRVLAALAKTDVPHPALAAACSDTGLIEGSVFYVMERVQGVNVRQSPAARHRDSTAVRREMGPQMALTAASVAAVDPEAVGLGEFGKPDGFLERQVERWRGELETHRSRPGDAGTDLPQVDEIGDWLDSNRPREWRRGLMHGDFHIANVLFEESGSRVTAIVDWELATVGDPFMDLGLMLAVWPSPRSRPLRGGLYDLDGLATPEAIVARYVDATGRDTRTLPWYVALAAFKLAIVLEGTYARSLAGQADADLGLQLHATAQRLLHRARESTAGDL